MSGGHAGVLQVQGVVVGWKEKRNDVRGSCMDEGLRVSTAAEMHLLATRTPLILHLWLLWECEEQV